jgi:anti-sigma factor RsiW
VTAKANGSNIDVSGVRLDGSLTASAVPRGERRRFEAHLAECPHCREYLAAAASHHQPGRDRPPRRPDPQMQDDFIALYRRWRADGDNSNGM